MTSPSDWSPWGPKSMIGTHLDQHKRIEAEFDEHRPRGHQYRDRPLLPTHSNGNGQPKTEPASVRLTVDLVMRDQLTDELEAEMWDLGLLKDEIDLELDEYLDTYLIFIHKADLAKAIERCRTRVKPLGSWNSGFQYIKKQATDYWQKYGKPEMPKNRVSPPIVTPGG